ncbi:hypothetical protein [Luteibaculum oceani]|uniref:TonB C-terminal domain-containing protein n=1 Tax=Luteibaculum oceani TaxID=1294296 RepID=A0A5C6VB18_9FLAO|nr:hypothetical protein [Luteibaculum oceani]TXC82110.1 hypothetical protein FRX97_03175 [Luteibaculum oceani]
MRIFLFIVGLIIFSTTHAQRIKRKKEFKKGEFIEYQYFKNENKEIVKHGTYEHFLFYSSENKVCIEKGLYIDNEKKGNWTYYDVSGDSIFGYNFTNDKITFINLESKFTYPTYYFNGMGRFGSCHYYSQERYPDEQNIYPPIPLGNYTDFYDCIYKSLIKAMQEDGFYASNLRDFFWQENHVGFIEFSIDAYGNTEKLKLIGIPDSYKERMKELILEEDLRWIPAIQANGKTTFYNFRIPFIAGFIKDEVYGDRAQYYSFSLFNKPEEYKWYNKENYYRAFNIEED